jgi:two-component system, NarL family, response regulator
MESTIRVMIADDYPALREGLAMILDEIAGLTMVALAAEGAEAIRLFSLHRPDVTLMDLEMPIMDGISATRQILRDTPGARIIILTCHESEEDIYRGLRAGAKSFLLKNTTIENLVEVIRAVHHGGRHLSPEIASKLADRCYEAELTERESAVLREMAKGESNEEIASVLKIAPGTVKTHVNHLLRKLEVADRTQAVIVAYKRGLVYL